MKTKPAPPQTIDDYIAGFPLDVQVILEKIRRTIQKAAPQAEETISYQMPTFTLKGSYLVYFAAFKKHIGFYAAPIGHPEFKVALAAYESGKGTLKFPLDQPMPYGLITKIVKFRAKENKAKAAKDQKK